MRKPAYITVTKQVRPDEIGTIEPAIVPSLVLVRLAWPWDGGFAQAAHATLADIAASIFGESEDA